jgi:hypothetical protein
MEQDWMMHVDAFGEANRADRLKHLESLTLESAAEELERILEMGPEIWRAARESGVPLAPDPLPGPSLAILLGRDPEHE